MKFWKKNDGLTLVELMISIAIGTMIFAAATTVLLLGIRINHHTTDSIMQQYTARTVITLLEKFAEDGDMGEIERNLEGSWWVYDKSGNELISYLSPNQAIYLRDQEVPILENIVASYLILESVNKDLDENSEGEPKAPKGPWLLTISLEDQDKAYSSSIFCRIAPEKTGTGFEEKPNDYLGIPTGPSENIAKDKTDFLGMLLTQVGMHGGIINHDKRPCAESSFCGIKCHKYNFFSQWYTDDYDSQNYPGWNTETPWCACFVSWGLCHAELLPSEMQKQKWYGNVDDFMAYFTEDTTGGWDKEPSPGDVIFFDMVGGTKDNPSHVGVVLSVEGNTVTTIEGNSADMVAVREYDLGDHRILGYGDPWAAQANETHSES